MSVNNVGLNDISIVSNSTTCSEINDCITSRFKVLDCTKLGQATECHEHNANVFCNTNSAKYKENTNGLLTSTTYSLSTNCSKTPDSLLIKSRVSVGSSPKKLMTVVKFLIIIQEILTSTLVVHHNK